MQKDYSKWFRLKIMPALPPPPHHHHHHSIYEGSIFTTFARSSEILKKFEECLV